MDFKLKERNIKDKVDYWHEKWFQCQTELNRLRQHSDKLAEIVKHNNETVGKLQAQVEDLTDQVYDLVMKNERVRETLEQIQTWVRAYPVKVFPEPDFKEAHEALQSAGLSLDEVSASNMRHVLSGVDRIIKQVLEDTDES